MVSTTMVLWILFSHWVADYVLQSRWMGDNKSSNWEAMFAHIGTYMAAMFVLVGWLVPAGLTNAPLAMTYVTINGAAHLATDSVTSRMTSHYYKNVSPVPWHKFWCVIGFDQFAHLAVLVLTLPILTV